jgi:Carbohydrate esterase, sialic acid-specific acetylesterase
LNDAAGTLVERRALLTTLLTVPLVCGFDRPAGTLWKDNGDFLRYFFGGRIAINGDPKGRQPIAPVFSKSQKTLTIVVAGQSLAANHENGSYATTSPMAQNLSIVDGAIYRADSPLLGCTGTGGNWLSRLADNLILQGWADRTVIVPIAFGGSAVNEWNYSLESRLIDIAKQRLDVVGLSADAIWWQQGTINTYRHTSKESYARDLAGVIKHFRDAGFGCPIFVCKESRKPGGEVSTEVRAAQEAAVDHGAGVYAGADGDSLDGSKRVEDLHWNEAGSIEMCRMAMAALEQYGPPFAPIAKG